MNKYNELDTKKIEKEIDKDVKDTAKQWKMLKFVIVHKRIQEESFGIYNGVFNSDCKRVYVKRIHPSTVDFLITELMNLSECVEAIQIEFDEYLGGHNIEFEIYLSPDNFNSSIFSSFEIQDLPCSVDVSERMYFELIQKLINHN